MVSLTLELTDEQRSEMSELLGTHADSDFRGGLMAQISNTGQAMDVIYLSPSERMLVGTMLENIKKRRAVPKT